MAKVTAVPLKVNTLSGVLTKVTAVPLKVNTLSGVLTKIGVEWEIILTLRLPD